MWHELEQVDEINICVNISHNIRRIYLERESDSNESTDVYIYNMCIGLLQPCLLSFFIQDIFY
jgi:hypothetical protein